MTDSCDHGNKINGKYEIKRIFANFLTQHGVVCVVCIRMGKGTGREDKLVPEKFQSTDNAGFTDAVVFTELYVHEYFLSDKAQNLFIIAVL